MHPRMAHAQAGPVRFWTESIPTLPDYIVNAGVQRLGTAKRIVAICKKPLCI